MTRTHTTKPCLKIGEINRFGEKKELNCIDYATTDHCKKNNPKAQYYDKFCNNCKEYLNEFITMCKCGNISFKILNWRTFCSKCGKIK